MPNNVPIVGPAPDARELVHAAFAAIAPGSVVVTVARDSRVVVDLKEQP